MNSSNSAKDDVIYLDKSNTNNNISPISNNCRNGGTRSQNSNLNGDGSYSSNNIITNLHHIVHLLLNSNYVT